MSRLRELQARSSRARFRSARRSRRPVRPPPGSPSGGPSPGGMESWKSCARRDRWARAGENPAMRFAALLALAAPQAGLRLEVQGACPGRDEVHAAVLRSMARANLAWPEQSVIGLRLREDGTWLRLELVGTDGALLLERGFLDEERDCAARAEAVGLVVARYLESLGWGGEPQRIRAR